ncbi:energy transducer TonB [Marinicellulosiphila megalodicopiae]|uniref:energy transducer TonB n=1 Tax=Marinicellulosiphila megalodicopiae TaxID=2724896 RepID=UPI003BB16CEF
MSTQSQPIVSSSDRFSFMLIIALAVHVLLIFGISFTALPTTYENQKAKEVIEVKLKSEISDEESDFLADSNQQGSGESDESHILSTTEQAEFNDTQVNQANQTPPIYQYFYQPSTKNQVISTQNKSVIKIEQQDLTEEEKKITEPNKVEQVNLNEISKKIESLNLKLAQIEETQAKKPKKVWNTAMSAKEDIEASYVYRLIQKIESIGNNNYPQAAIEQNLSGTIRVVFVLNQKGELINFEIAQSSGHDILDNAVKHIISQASPFEKFSPSLIQGKVQEVHIIRTWIFDSNQRFTMESL